MWLRWTLLALLALPLVEVILFVAIWAQIGFLSTFLAALATSLLGVAILKQAGRARLTRLRAALAEGGGDASTLAEGGGLVTGLAGVLLVLPGFLTDALGLLLLLPATRAWLRLHLTRTIRPAAGGPGGRSGDGRTIDLSPQDWRQVPDPGEPGKRPPEVS